MEYAYDVFLSYGSQDRSKVKKLAERLQNDGLSVWLGEKIIEPGDHISLAIQKGLQNSRVMVFVLSCHSIGMKWPELERGTVVFRGPTNEERWFILLRLDDSKIPDVLERYLAIDYRQENEDEYQKLLGSLRGNQTKTIPLREEFNNGKTSSAPDQYSDMVEEMDRDEQVQKFTEIIDGFHRENKPKIFMVVHGHSEDIPENTIDRFYAHVGIKFNNCQRFSVEWSNKGDFYKNKYSEINDYLNNSESTGMVIFIHETIIFGETFDLNINLIENIYQGWIDLTNNNKQSNNKFIHMLVLRQKKINKNKLTEKFYGLRVNLIYYYKSIKKNEEFKLIIENIIKKHKENFEYIPDLHKIDLDEFTKWILQVKKFFKRFGELLEKNSEDIFSNGEKISLQDLKEWLLSENLMKQLARLSE